MTVKSKMLNDTLVAELGSVRDQLAVLTKEHADLGAKLSDLGEAETDILATLGYDPMAAAGDPEDQPEEPADAADEPAAE